MKILPRMHVCKICKSHNQIFTIDMGKLDVLARVSVDPALNLEIFNSKVSEKKNYIFRSKDSPPNVDFNKFQMSSTFLLNSLMSF